MRLFTIFILSLFALFQSTQAKQLKVAVIDTGLDLSDKRFKPLLCEAGHHDFTGGGIADWHGHGTHVTGLIKEHAGGANYCLIILKFYHDDKAPATVNTVRLVSAIKRAIQEKADIVNISGGGSLYNEEEYEAIRSAKNIMFIVSAGNESSNIDSPGTEYFPASYSLHNVIPVGSLDNYGRRAPHSNYGDRIHWEIGVDVKSTAPCASDKKPECYTRMSGTSMAAAVTTGKVVSGLLKLRRNCSSGTCELYKK